MNKANNNDDSQSEKFSIGQNSGGRRLQFSPIADPPSRENIGDNEVNVNNTNYKNPTTAGVKEYCFVQQSMLPLPAQEDSDTLTSILTRHQSAVTRKQWGQ